MQTNKRSGDLIAFSHESKKTCSGVFANHDVCCELSEAVASNVAKSVVSLALGFGTPMLFICSGTVIEHYGNFSRILTSASLIRALHDERKKNPSVQITVKHEERVTKAFLEKCNLDLEIAIVRTLSSLRSVDSVHLDHPMEFLPHSKVFAAGCDGHGRVMFERGTLAGSRGSDVFVSTCKFPKEYEGGALFDVDGNFLGLNLFSGVQSSIFLPKSLILDQQSKSPLRSSFIELIQQFKAGRIERGLPGEILGSYTEAYKEVPNKDQLEEIVSLGYPKPPLNSYCDMILVNSFEERFGDIYPLGAWNEFGQKLHCVSQNVVALASFKGETRIFACTGCFIDWTDTYPTILTSASLVDPAGRGNEVNKDFTIQVLLPDKTLSEGTLQYCDFDYNVAVVRVKDFCPLVPPPTLNDKIEISSRLVAVGRLFKSGVLMAASGKPTCWSGRLSCKALVYLSCKITKAGIGGPLVDVAGNFVGMNFYDPKIGTPFLSQRDICKVLESFKKQCTDAENCQTQFGFRYGITEVTPKHKKMWPVPEPRWHSLNDRVHCDISEEEQIILICRRSFGYSDGIIIVNH